MTNIGCSAFVPGLLRKVPEKAALLRVDWNPAAASGRGTGDGREKRDIWRVGR